MTFPAKTLFLFGLYLAAVALALLVTPNAVLTLLGIPNTHEIWVRIVGLLALYLAIYDMGAAKGNWVAFIRLSVPLRMSAIAFFAAFVMLTQAPKQLLLFAVVDFAASLWTWSALRSSAQPRSGHPDQDESIAQAARGVAPRTLASARRLRWVDLPPREGTADVEDLQGKLSLRRGPVRSGH